MGWRGQRGEADVEKDARSHRAGCDVVRGKERRQGRRMHVPHSIVRELGSDLLSSVHNLGPVLLQSRREAWGERGLKPHREPEDAD